MKARVLFTALLATTIITSSVTMPAAAQTPASEIDAHIDAIRAIVRDNIRDSDHPVGKALANELEARVSAYVPTDARSSSTAP